jgi:lysophospholipase L1-like esterase
MRSRLLATAIATGCAALAAPGTAAAAYPSSMDALGDSITRAFNTCSFPAIDCPANSWATGTSTTVNSHYLRIRSANPAIEGRNYNDAVSGAQADDLLAQANSAVSRGVEYVTVAIGANDACTSSESTMTPVETFRTEIAAGLSRLASGLPNARVFVGSVPDVYHLWYLFHTDRTAVRTWNSLGICQSMLANATSTAQTDEDRRQRVRQRVIDFNNVLQAECAKYANCKFDGFTAFDYKFAKTDVSTRDYFHPSVAGQATIARISWGVTWQF